MTVGGISSGFGSMNTSMIRQMMEQRFNSDDSDKNGTLDKTEFQAAVNKMAEQTGVTQDVDTLFSAIDTNSDGALTLDEMISSRPQGPPPPPPPTTSTTEDDESTADLFNTIDSDGDGVIDTLELQTFMDNNGLSVDTLFSQIDTDSDGGITVNELDTFLSRVKEGMEGNFPPPPPMNTESTQSTDDIFGKIDTNGDGSIDKSELLTYVNDTMTNTDSLSSLLTDSLKGLNTDSSNTLDEEIFNLQDMKNRLLEKILSAYKNNGNDDADNNSISLYI